MFSHLQTYYKILEDLLQNPTDPFLRGVYNDCCMDLNFPLPPSEIKEEYIITYDLFLPQLGIIKDSSKFIKHPEYFTLCLDLKIKDKYTWSDPYGYAWYYTESNPQYLHNLWFDIWKLLKAKTNRDHPHFKNYNTIEEANMDLKQAYLSYARSFKDLMFYEKYH